MKVTRCAQGWIATILLMLFALARPLRADSDDKGVGKAWLPPMLAGQKGRVVALDSSEARLARRGNVAVTKVRYGPTLATSLVVSGGIREHHPASVCLRSSGLEIISKDEHRGRAGCVQLLRVRRGASEASVVATYLGQDGRATCSLGRRILAGAWARLWGTPSRWTHLQVLDADSRRALARLQLLIRAMPRRISK